MSKSIVRVLVSAVVAGVIAGGAMALYGLASKLQLRNSLQLSDWQAAAAATFLGILALAMAFSTLRGIPDNKKAPIEDSILVVLSSVASFALVGASFVLMGLVSTLPQLWLTPAVVFSVVASFLGLLSLALGMSAVIAWVPDQDTAKAR